MAASLAVAAVDGRFPLALHTDRRRSAWSSTAPATAARSLDLLARVEPSADDPGLAALLRLVAARGGRLARRRHRPAVARAAGRRVPGPRPLPDGVRRPAGRAVRSARRTPRGCARRERRHERGLRRGVELADQGLTWRTRGRWRRRWRSSSSCVLGHRRRRGRLPRVRPVLRGVGLAGGDPRCGARRSRASPWPGRCGAGPRGSSRPWDWSGCSCTRCSCCAPGPRRRPPPRRTCSRAGTGCSPSRCPPTRARRCSRCPSPPGSSPPTWRALLVLRTSAVVTLCLPALGRPAPRARRHGRARDVTQVPVTVGVLACLAALVLVRANRPDPAAVVTRAVAAEHARDDALDKAVGGPTRSPRAGRPRSGRVLLGLPGVASSSRSPRRARCCCRSPTAPTGRTRATPTRPTCGSPPGSPRWSSSSRSWSGRRRPALPRDRRRGEQGPRGPDPAGRARHVRRRPVEPVRHVRAGRHASPHPPAPAAGSDVVTLEVSVLTGRSPYLPGGRAAADAARHHGRRSRRTRARWCGRRRTTPSTGPVSYTLTAAGRPGVRHRHRRARARCPAQLTALPDVPSWVSDEARKAQADWETPWTQLSRAGGLPGGAPVRARRPTGPLLRRGQADARGRRTPSPATPSSTRRRSRSSRARWATRRGSPWATCSRDAARSGDTYTVTSTDVHAWPEVLLDGYGWVAFEPTDTGNLAGPQPPRDPEAAVLPQRRRGRPARPARRHGDRRGERAVRAARSPRSRAAPPTSSSGSSCSTLLLLVGRRRGQARPAVPAPARGATPPQQVAGAWRETTDRLREIGVPTPPTWTPIEVAHRADHATSDGGRRGADLAALARLATAAVYAPTPAVERRRAAGVGSSRSRYVRASPPVCPRRCAGGPPWTRARSSTPRAAGCAGPLPGRRGGADHGTGACG